METWANRWYRVDISFIGKVISISGVLAAILNFLLISMSVISDDCTIVFPTFETIDLAVRIVPISQFLAVTSISGLRRFYGRHLEFLADIDVGR